MRLFKTDRLVPLVTISLIILFSFMLYADFTGSHSRSREDEIGTLAYEKRIAQRRYAEEVVWESIDRDARVYNCDYLRTTEGSGAIVRLDDGTDIEMDENTLLMVCRSKEGVSIDLDSGSIATRKKQGDRAMKISSRYASIAVREGVLDVDVTKKGLNLSVSEGSAEMTAAGKSEKVGQGFEASVSGDAIKKEKAFARQVLPGINSYYVTAEKERRVDFSWEADAGRAARLQVSNNAAFTAMAADVAVGGENKTSLELPAGTYFWRLADEAGKTGTVRVFTIVNDRPAVPVAPVQAEQISARGKTSFVRFAWETAAAASSYTVTVGRDPGFKNIALTLKSDADSIATDELGPGSYYWRIRNDYGFSTDTALYSGVRQFSIARAAAIPAPEPLVPADGGTVSDLSIAAGSALFNWTGIAGCAGYEFAIARDAGFGKLAYSETTGNNFHKPRVPLYKGTYFWRVRGVAESGAFSPYSRALKLAVVGAVPPVLVAPAPGAVIVTDGTSRLAFRWSGPDGGQRYRFELSADRDFKKLLVGTNVSGLTHSVAVPGTGTYFWRVKLLAAGGPSLASEHRRLSVTEGLEAPAGTFPANNEAVTIQSRSGMIFKWDMVKGATHYQVKVKRLVDGREKEILTTRVKTNRYRLTRTELLDAGQFAWEVTAVRQDDSGAEVRSGTEQNYFTIKPGKQLEAPKLKSRVLYVE